MQGHVRWKIPGTLSGYPWLFKVIGPSSNPGFLWLPKPEQKHVRRWTFEEILVDWPNRRLGNTKVNNQCESRLWDACFRKIHEKWEFSQGGWLLAGFLNNKWRLQFIKYLYMPISLSCVKTCITMSDQDTNIYLSQSGSVHLRSWTQVPWDTTF